MEEEADEAAKEHLKQISALFVPDVHDEADFFEAFVPDPLGCDGEYRSRFLDHTNMRITEEHLDQFSAAILSFWQEVPSEMWLRKGEVEVPKWFEKAYLKDRVEHERA